MKEQLILLASDLGRVCQAKGLKLSLAESCTGGGVCQLITEIAGSSAWFECGFVCYSNQSKIKMLNVNPETLAKFGAVSAETALEMATGAWQKSGADVAVSVTGIAGPEGGSIEKPVGMVFIAIKTAKQVECYQNQFVGDRAEIREQSIRFVIKKLLERMIN